MVKDRIPVQRPSVNLPRDVEGLVAVIKGLKELYPDTEGYGPEILRALKVQIGRVAKDKQEMATLEEVFDNKLAELVLHDMDKFANKRERVRKGFNAADRKSNQVFLEMFLKYDIPGLPMFDEHRRAALVVRAEKKIWEKGYIPGERKE